MDIVLCMREQGTMEKTPSMDVSEYCGRIQDLCDKLSSVFFFFFIYFLKFTICPIWTFDGIF